VASFCLVFYNLTTIHSSSRLKTSFDSNRCSFVIALPGELSTSMIPFLDLEC
jgi:hypothetical protein